MAINSPTFQLSTTDKPDTSEYLYHVTNKINFYSILKGKEKSESGETSLYIKSNIPDYDKRVYPVSTVCFTETPYFALDFFNRRSFKRKNHKYAIGFRKELLVLERVKPLLYTPIELTGYINSYYNEYRGNRIHDDNKLQNFIESLYKLTFPLLEKTDNQGFMWEREWRYIEDEDGFEAPYRWIKVICCPNSELEGIKKKINLEHIKYYDMEVEYDKVIELLNNSN